MPTGPKVGAEQPGGVPGEPDPVSMSSESLEVILKKYFVSVTRVGRVTFPNSSTNLT